ncbi:MAG: class I SAM-dependent methyltransferase [Acetatifactor sp.]|nr:class I SAM-dependent methyltransferase [Acetatifactor sp.]
MNQTISYYEEHAAEFCKSTLDADMSFCRNKFLKYLNPQSRILDAGCGSGRDSKVFADLGYYVTAMDASPKICEEAGKVLGQKVLCQSFEELDMEKMFDGIWACASLLHVSKEKIPNVLHKLKRALKDEGILYASFKYGDGEAIRQGRYFSNHDEWTLKKLMQDAGFEILELFVTEDVRKGRSGEKWVNVIGKK